MCFNGSVMTDACFQPLFLLLLLLSEEDICCFCDWFLRISSISAWVGPQVLPPAESLFPANYIYIVTPLFHKSVLFSLNIYQQQIQLISDEMCKNLSGLVSLPRGQNRGLPTERSCRAKLALSRGAQGVSVGDSCRFTPTFYRGDARRATVESQFQLGALLNRDTDPRWWWCLLLLSWQKAQPVRRSTTRSA